MRGLRDLVAAHPWSTVAGAFVLGATFAMDRGTRRAILLAGLELGRQRAVQYAAEIAHAWIDRGDRPYARA